MKILMTGYTVPQSGVPGTSMGISKYIYYIAKELVLMDYDVDLFIRDDIKQTEPWIHSVYSPKISWLVYPPFLFNQIKNEQADIYFSDYTYTGLPLIWGKKRPSIV